MMQNNNQLEPQIISFSNESNIIPINNNDRALIEAMRILNGQLVSILIEADNTIPKYDSAARLYEKLQIYGSIDSTGKIKVKLYPIYNKKIS